ncbi:Nitrate/nitrite transporter [Patulibacter medicamentivorans]|uniref:Nitrate/nitrite transporter n=1 Tax=Patulibacter medicamentivorans TaxID=1097667 RepID=H0E197_9ACTN|nr:MFS transporter [Patulibacter medicamentivorans]EHN12536.1 Nitrate/nitrite transporter [Patulibacter medicamentivorans]
MSSPTPTSVASTRESPESRRALLVSTIAFTACFYAWSLLGPLGPDLQDHLALSDLELSMAVALPVVLGSLMRIPMGILSDRHGARLIFALLLAWTIAPLLALAAWHSSLGVLLVLGFLLGFAGSSFAVGVPFVSRWYGAQRQGFALGVYGAGMGGTVLAGLTAPAISDVWGLSAPFLVAAGLVAVALAVWLATARDAPRASAGASPPARRSIVAVYRAEPRALALTLFYFVAFGGFVSMFLYLPKLLTGVHELSKTDAGARAAGFAALAVVARPLGGWLADRVGAERVLRWSFAGTACLALVLAAGYTRMLPLTIACLTLAVALGLGTGAVFKLVGIWFPAEVGGVTGVVSAAGGLGGFFPPLLMGVVNGATGGYALGFALLAGIAATALVVLRRSRTPRPSAAETAGG